jgi:hypothetical protein
MNFCGHIILSPLCFLKKSENILIMKEPLNSAAWIEWARKAGIDISSAFRQDKRAIYSTLRELGLPAQEVLLFPAKGYEGKEDEIREFIREHKTVFVRLNPRKEGLKRPYKEGVRSMEELREFILSSGVDTADYELHIVQEGGTRYGGAIVNSERLAGELHRGKLADLTQGKVTPLTAIFDETKGRFVFINDGKYSAGEKAILLRAVRMTKDLSGYFQFTVNEKGQIIFNNYRPKGEFAKI